LRVVYLTHVLHDSIDWKAIAEITGYALVSVDVGYRSPGLVVGVRRRIPVRFLVWDSGGFQAFTKGLRVSVEDTIRLYRLAGFFDGDLLVELDLVPLYNDSRETRFEKIRSNLENYRVMVDVFGDRVLYVVHGWSLEELDYAVSIHRSYDSKVAVGSYYVTSVISRIPRRVVFARFNDVMRIVRRVYRWVFVLGGSGPNMVHLSFYVGANAIDGVSWRNSALRKELVIPGIGVRALGSSQRRRLSSEDIDVLRQWWKEPINPFKDMKIEEFLALASRNDTLGFRVRGLWNATALKLEERIANEYINDPDRYYNYLMKRWRNNNFWRNILKIIRSDYVQSKLTVYLRSSLGG